MELVGELVQQTAMSMLRAVRRGVSRVVHWPLYVGRMTAIYGLLVVSVALIAVSVVPFVTFFAAAVSSVVVAVAARIPPAATTVPSGGRLQDQRGDNDAGEKCVHSTGHVVFE